MDLNKLMDSLASFRGDVPSEVQILQLRRSSIEEQQQRLRKLLKVSGDACDCRFERGQWETSDELTVVRLPRGARAELYHASGAVRFNNGTPPMERLFRDSEPKKQLIERSDRFLQGLGIAETLGRGETLTFERLWLSKAAGADKQGKRTEPVLCRAVAAYRHRIEGIPVLGPASITMHLDGEGGLDAFSTLLRSPGGEALDRAKVIPPERAARQIVQRLVTQFEAPRAGSLKTSEFDIECRDGLLFGYFSLSKRKGQRLLAPVYAAVLDVQHEKVRQGLVHVVAATERNYLQLDFSSQESPTPATSKFNGKRCCR